MEEKKKRDSSCIVISCVDRREEAIKREWAARVQENDHIVAEGFADRQIQNTLSLVEPIKLEPGPVEKKQEEET